MSKRTADDFHGESGSGSSGGPSSNKRFKQDSEDQENDFDCLIDSQISHRNQPVLMEIYIDPVTEREILVIVAYLIGGVTDVEFSLVGSGPGCSIGRITYTWPEMSIDVEDLFELPINKKNIEEQLPACHPKMLAIKKGLHNTRESIDVLPKGVIDLNLPIAVQTAADTIKRRGKKKPDGTTVLIVELMAYESAYTVKQDDQKILFEKSDSKKKNNSSLKIV